MNKETANYVEVAIKKRILIFLFAVGILAASFALGTHTIQSFAAGEGFIDAVGWSISGIISVGGLCIGISQLIGVYQGKWFKEMD